MKRMFLLFFLVFVIADCTGGSIDNVIVLTRNHNQNPTPEYGYPFVNYAKGWLYHNDSFPGQVGSNAESKLRGEACQMSFLFLLAWGDSSIEAAKKQGKITRVATLEYEQTGILAILYHSFCTKVTGDDLPVGASESKTTAVEESTKSPAKTPAKKGK